MLGWLESNLTGMVQCQFSPSAKNLLLGVDDINKSRLQAGTTDKETVNIRLLAQLLAVLLADTATVQNAGLVRSLVVDGLLEPLADSGVNLLCLLGSGNLASADGPDGLVGNDNLGPVTGANLGLEGVQLLGDDRDGRAGLTLLERLAAAPDDADAVVGSVLGLGSDNLVRLAENGPSLAVTQDRPGDVAVKELRDGQLTSEGTVGLVVDVLRGDGDLLAQRLTDGDEVEGWWGNNDLCGQKRKGWSVH